MNTFSVILTHEIWQYLCFVVSVILEYNTRNSYKCQFKELFREVHKQYDTLKWKRIMYFQFQNFERVKQSIYQHSEVSCCFHLCSYPENGSSTFIWNVTNHLTDDIASHTGWTKLQYKWCLFYCSALCLCFPVMVGLLLLWKELGTKRKATTQCRHDLLRWMALSVATAPLGW